MKEGTLCQSVVDDRVLLIEKKHGLGAIKIIRPGRTPGDGETPVKAAVREAPEMEIPYGIGE